jgi:O-acetyl-ADP-ribose deacetylase (regulator of RNase III)
MTKGYNLPARYVIHTVGPRYNLKYITAAESALYSCYRNTLQLCR